MRLLVLYLRGRLAGYALIYLLFITVVTWLGTGWTLETPLQDAERTALVVPMLLFMPLAAALVTGVSVHDPSGELETIASRSMPILRLIHMVLLLAWAVLALCVGAAAWRAPYPELTLTRNLVGFAGLSLLGARTLGGRLSWIAPFTYAGFAILKGAVSRDEFAWWAFPLQPATDVISASTVVILLTLGLGSVCLLGEANLTRGGNE